MAIDNKNTKHICNVIRRQIQNCFPDLYIEFIIHEDGDREKAFIKNINSIESNPAGSHLIKYIQSNNYKKSLIDNKSHFAALAHQHNSGFLGFFKNSNYIAICFLNHTHLNNDNDLRNNAIHLAWHAINLYQLSKDEATKKNYKFNNHILTPNFLDEQRYHNNLLADIFTASLQELQGRKGAFKALLKQRIKDTITPQKGFIAEDYPFPMCIDTLEYILKNDIDQYKNGKKPVISALKITKNIGKTYQSVTMEQWRIFSIPSQEMAWLGYSPDSILGTALYTSESIHAQSIADIITESLEIRPEAITSINDYNPFTDLKTNETMHEKQCEDLITSALNKIIRKEDYNILLDIAKKQNNSLLEKSIMGWCANGLIAASNTIKESTSESITEESLNQAKDAFNKEINSIKWDTLTYFSEVKYKSQRNGSAIKMSNILKLAKSYDEFSSIHQAINFTESLNNEEIKIKSTNHKQKSITSFISKNAIKK